MRPKVLGAVVASLCSGLLMVALFSGCRQSLAVAEPPPTTLVDSGSWYVRVPWPHDGHPYESDRFVVYSDSADYEIRRQLADQAERIWSEILSDMGIQDELLSLPPGQAKLDIYAFKEQDPDWAGKAYYGGLVISSPDRRTLFGLVGPTPSHYESILKHELVHVASLSLLHSQGLVDPPRVPVWFFEGLAEVVSGGSGSGAIEGKDHFDSLTSKYGRLNPVSYVSDEGIEGGPGAFSEYHYPMRQLAVEYLFDEDGYRNELADATGLLVDMAGGEDFDTAFNDRMGISVSEYEDEFFQLMDEYLPDRSTPVAFTPAGLLATILLTTGVASAASVRSLHSHAGAGGAQTESPGSVARAGRIGFALWITAVSALSLATYVIGAYTVGRSWSLSGTGKTMGIAALIGYLTMATLVLTWAIRRRRGDSRLAWLIPTIAVAATVVALGAILMVP